MTYRIQLQLAISAAVIVLLAGCSEEPPPPSVDDFVENEVLLEATLIRCTQNRAEMRYEPECVNVREAVNLIAVSEEKARREQLEAQSTRKREALRRTQRAVAEARRRAAERERQAEQDSLYGEFDEVPVNGLRTDDGVAIVTPHPEAAPTAPGAGAMTESAPTVADSEPDPAPAVDETLATDATSDIEAVRQELKRRDEDGTD